MKLMMSPKGVVTEDGERVEGIQSVTYDMATCDNDTMSISLAPGGVYEGDVKPLKEDLEPKLPKEVRLKVISDGSLCAGHPEDTGTHVIDVETGRPVRGVERVEWIADAGGELKAIVHFNQIEVDIGLPIDVQLSFKRAIEIDRKMNGRIARARHAISRGLYDVKRLLKKLW